MDVSQPIITIFKTDLRALDQQRGVLATLCKDVTQEKHFTILYPEDGSLFDLLILLAERQIAFSLAFRSTKAHA